MRRSLPLTLALLCPGLLVCMCCARGAGPPSVRLLEVAPVYGGSAVQQIFQCQATDGRISDGYTGISWFLNDSALEVNPTQRVLNGRLILVGNISSDLPVALALQCSLEAPGRPFNMISPYTYAHNPPVRRDPSVVSVVEARLGGAAFLPCPFQLYDDVRLKPRFTINNGTVDSRHMRYRLLNGGLQVLDVQRSDNGTAYTCCLHPLGTCASAVFLNVLSQTLQKQPPHILQRPVRIIKVIEAVQGASVLLECTTAWRVPTVAWIRLDGASNGVPQPDGSLLLKNVSLADQAEYICLSGNAYLLFKLTVSPALKVSMKLRPPSGDDGQGELVCLGVGARDASQLRLYKNGQLIARVAGGERLKVPLRWPPTSASYQCMLTSGRLMADARLTTKPRRWSRALIFGADHPPVFVRRPDNESGVIGTEVFLYTTTKHADRIAWFFNSTPVVIDENRISLVGSGTLQIRNVSFSDQGLYKCIISNQLGQDSVEVWLNVELPYEPVFVIDDPFDRSHDDTVNRPNQPSRVPKLHVRLDAPEVSRLSNTSVLLRWELPSDDQLPSEPLLYRIQYKKILPAGSPLPPVEWETVDGNVDADSRSYVLGDLEPGVAYKFRYAVIFKHLQPVTSRTSKRILLTRTQGVPPPSVAPDLMTVVSKWPDAMEVKWEVNPEERAPIDGYIVQYRRVYSNLAMPFINETIFGGETRSHMIDHLLPASPYEVRMVSFNAGGSSPPSETTVTSTRTLDGEEAVINFFVEHQPVEPTQRPAAGAESRSIYTTAGIVFGVVAIVNVIIVVIYMAVKWHKGRRKHRQRQMARSFNDTSFSIFKEGMRGKSVVGNNNTETYPEMVAPTVRLRDGGRYVASSLCSLAVVERQPLVSDDQMPNSRSAPLSCTL